MLPKPTRGIRLNKSHPLARGLVGYWLFNEGSGNKVFDLSGNRNTGTLVADTHFVPGKFGPALSYDGTGDSVVMGAVNTFGDTDYTLVVWVKLSAKASVYAVIGKGKNALAGGADSIEYAVAYSSGDDRWRFTIADQTNYQHLLANTLGSPSIGVWYQVVCIHSATENKVYIYINGKLDNSAATTVTPSSSTGSFNIGSWDLDSVNDRNLNGQIDHAMICNRALSASEIALLYREPFCMFDRASCNLKFQISNFKFLAGTAASTSDVSAVLGLRCGLTASTGGFTAVDGSLGIMGESPPEIQRSWLTEALFNGMTANAFKLGTSLSSGWFWVRVTGCSVLYRGAGMGGIGGVDFTNILTVSERNAREISPPSYISHNSGSTYFYVVRRFNNCGYQERTLAAAVKVSIKSNGELAEPQPNNIFSSKVEQVASNKIRLAWFYCPLEQKSQPVSFNVYYDDRTGQIDYQNPLATIGYKGRKFYSFQSSALETGKYLFAIRAKDASGIENTSLARLKIQLDTLNPDAIGILRTEAV